MHFILKILFAFAILTSFATANPFLPDCSDAKPTNSCTMQWVNNGQHFELDWAPLAPQHDAVLVTNAHPALKANSALPPAHVDVDHDGYKDLVFFTLLGMVNGDFAIHRFVPETNTYKRLGQINGTHYNLDKSGFLVSVGRSSCCESTASFYRISLGELTLAFQMDVRPTDLSTGIDQCTINPVDTGPSLTAIKRDNAKMIADYCDYYQETGAAKIKSRSWSHDAALNTFHDIAPNAVFYCQIVGTDKHVEITRDIETFTYAYGTINQKPDLTFAATGNDASYMADNGAGSTRFGYIKMKTGDYNYQAHYSYQINLLEETATISETLHGLIVEKEGTDAAIFDKTCNPNSVLNLIPELDFEG